jgi:hypothetical protein
LAEKTRSHKIDNPVRKPLLDAQGSMAEEVGQAVSASAGLTGQRDVLNGIKGKAHILVETAIRQKFNEQPRDSLL